MRIRQITTENPIAEQWRLLSQFTYPVNAKKMLVTRGFSLITDETLEFVSGNMRQAQAYFSAAGQAPLDVSPLLVYYGATSLLSAVSTLVTNSSLSIQNHGMVLQNQKATRIADVRFLPRNRLNGALQLFCDVFSPGCDLMTGEAWTLGEVLGSIPDLKSDFENHYPDLKSFCAPVVSIRANDRQLDRIANSELSRYVSPEEAMKCVYNLNKAYLAPQYHPDFVILFRRRNGQDISDYSVSGQRFLDFSHRKQAKSVTPHQMILMFMGLYVLGYLPRYRPHLWNPFVRSDTTGEKYIIDRFISVCIRYFPNLALGFVLNDWVQFVNQPEGIDDRTKSGSRDELKALVREVLKDLRVSGDPL